MDPKSLTADFRDFLKFLGDHGVVYLLSGGHAVAPRLCQDDAGHGCLDCSQSRKRQTNGCRNRIFFGTKPEGLVPEWFLDPEQVTRFGARPNLIEILARIDGGDFAAAYAERVVGELEGCA
jgi:hypothetical protein